MSDSPPSSPTSAGLSTAEAERRLAQYGPNAVADKVVNAWRVFLGKLWAPVPWLLEAAIALQIALGEWIEAAVIGVLLLFNAVLAVLQESRANQALTILKQRLAPSALVCRDGRWQRCAAADLVPGDVIRLSLGTVVPADAKITLGSVLVDQSMLTGESVPAEIETGDTVYAGAQVRRGQATAQVKATGARTYFGRTAELVQIAHAASTEQSAILSAVRNLAVINGAVAVATVAYAQLLGLPDESLLRLILTVLLASIPVALPATFTLSAALTAQSLGRQGVLLTRLAAVHEAAAMDLLCSDKTGTLTRNTLEIEAVAAMPGHDRQQVLAYAALASSDVDQDAVDAAIRRAAAEATLGLPLIRFVPFDPVNKTAEAIVMSEGRELRIVKGALQALSVLAPVSRSARARADELAAQGHRVLAVAAGVGERLELIGLIALSDPPRPDSAPLIQSLTRLGVHTIMVTGDSAATAAAIARQVGLPDRVCPVDLLTQQPDTAACSVFARVLPQHKFGLVKILQERGHTVGMCGDGANDAPALKQAQVGIAVSTATDVAKAAAAMVLTEPGLAGVLTAVREGRMAFQRLLTYTLNMLVKKIEVVLLLAVGMVLVHRAVLTPMLMVLLLLTNDFLTMSLSTDHAEPDDRPARWHMRPILIAATVMGLCKLGFSLVVLWVGLSSLDLDLAHARTLTFVAVAFGNQAVLYALRLGKQRRWLWPGQWLLLSSIADLAIVAMVAVSGILMAPIGFRTIAIVATAALGFSVTAGRLAQSLLAPMGRI